jgi:hypothetical protein
MAIRLFSCSRAIKRRGPDAKASGPYLLRSSSGEQITARRENVGAFLSHIVEVIQRGRYNAGVTMQTLKIGNREFVLLARRDFEKLAAQAQRQAEDDYWTKAALAAEARARAKHEKPIPFELVEREIDARKKPRDRRRQRRR